MLSSSPLVKKVKTMDSLFHWLTKHLITDRMLISELKHRGCMELILTSMADIGDGICERRVLQLPPDLERLKIENCRSVNHG